MFRRSSWLKTVCILILSAFSSGAFAQGTTNVALRTNGALAIADSVYAHFSSDQAIDGLWLAPGEYAGNNRWHSSLGQPHPQWVWIQFSGVARIDRVVIHLADPIVQPVDFVGEHIAPGDDKFQPLFSVEGLHLKKDQNSYEKTFEPVETNNFRLRINRSSYEQYRNYAQLSEIEAFGDLVEPKGANLTSAAAHPERQFSVTEADGLATQITDEVVQYQSPWLRIAFSRKRPQVTQLCWDTIGEGKTATNLLKPGEDGGARLLFPGLEAPSEDTFDFQHDGNIIRYALTSENGAKALWEARVTARAFDVALSYVYPETWVLRSAPRLQFAFAVDQTPVSPLSNPTDLIPAPVPALVHASDFGTLLVESLDERKGSLMVNPIRSAAR